MAVVHLTVKRERLFVDISSPSTANMHSKRHQLLIVEDRSTANMHSKRHQLLIVEDSIDYVRSYFLKEKSELKDLMLSLLRVKSNVRH